MERQQIQKSEKKPELPDVREVTKVRNDIKIHENNEEIAKS